MTNALVQTVIDQLAKERSSATNEFIRCINTDLQAALNSLATNSTPGQLPGTSTNDNAAAGNVGEYKVASVAYSAAVNIVTNTYTNLTNLYLTPGDWDVSADMKFNVNPGTLLNAIASIPTKTSEGDSSTAYSSYTRTYFGAAGVGSGAYGLFGLTNRPVRVSLAAGRAIFLVSWAVFTVSTVAAFGTIRARRAR